MDSNHRCLDVSQESWPLDHGTVCVCASACVGISACVCISAAEAEAVGLEPTTVCTAPVFETGPSSGRMTSVVIPMRSFWFQEAPSGSRTRTTALAERQAAVTSWARPAGQRPASRIGHGACESPPESDRPTKRPGVATTPGRGVLLHAGPDVIDVSCDIGNPRQNSRWRRGDRNRIEGWSGATLNGAVSRTQAILRQDRAVVAARLVRDARRTGKVQGDCPHFSG